MYPIKEVPVEAEALTDWLYQRFVEKDELLAHFYDTGLSRTDTHKFSSELCEVMLTMITLLLYVYIFQVLISYD